MLLLRKIDWHIEIIILFVMTFLVLIFSCFSFLAGLFVLGCWQPVSGLLNSRTFIHTGFKREIRKYWLLTGIDLLAFGSAVSFSGKEPATIFYVIILTAATAIAIYYLYIYKNLIATLELKNELSAFTKS